MWIIGFNNILYRRNNQIRLIAVYAGINGGLVLFYGKPGMNIWKTWTEDFGKPGIYILEIGNLFGIIITRRQTSMQELFGYIERMNTGESFDYS